MSLDARALDLDLLLLASVRSQPGHGYAIIDELRRKSQGAIDLHEGSVYPTLHRLEEEGLLASHWTRVSGRRRRVYELTSEGRAALGERQAGWRAYVEMLQVVLEP